MPRTWLEAETSDSNSSDSDTNRPERFTVTQQVTATNPEDSSSDSDPSSSNSGVNPPTRPTITREIPIPRPDSTLSREARRERRQRRTTRIRERRAKRELRRAEKETRLNQHRILAGEKPIYKYSTLVPRLPSIRRGRLVTVPEVELDPRTRLTTVKSDHFDTDQCNQMSELWRVAAYVQRIEQQQGDMSAKMDKMLEVVGRISDQRLMSPPRNQQAPCTLMLNCRTGIPAPPSTTRKYSGTWGQQGLC